MDEQRFFFCATVNVGYCLIILLFGFRRVFFLPFGFISYGVCVSMYLCVCMYICSKAPVFLYIRRLAVLSDDETIYNARAHEGHRSLV